MNYKDVYFPVLDAIIVSAADGTASSVYEKVPPVAQECIITWCVKTLNSSYAEGKYQETVVWTFLNHTTRQQQYPWSVIPNTDYSLDMISFDINFTDNITIQPPGTDISFGGYGVSNESFSRTQVLFKDMFPSFITVTNSTAPAWWRVKVFEWP